MRNEWIKYEKTHSDLYTHRTRSFGTRVCLTVTKYHSYDDAFEAKLPSKIEKVQLQVFICIVGIGISIIFIHSKCHAHDQGTSPA